MHRITAIARHLRSCQHEEHADVCMHGRVGEGEGKREGMGVEKKGGEGGRERREGERRGGEGRRRKGFSQLKGFSRFRIADCMSV